MTREEFWGAPPMRPRQFRDELIAFVKTIGPRAEVSVILGSWENSVLSATTYPVGMGRDCACCLRRRFRALGRPEVSAEHRSRNR
jgi:hypothetical protein